MAQVSRLLHVTKLLLTLVLSVSFVSALEVTTEATNFTTASSLSTPIVIDTTTSQPNQFESLLDEDDVMEVASSDAKSKWDTKTQALFKHRGLSSLRKRMRNVRRREDKDKVSTTTTTTTSAPDVSAVPVSPLMPIVPFDSIFAAASQASYSPQMFDPMAQYLPPPASYLARASTQQQYIPSMASNPIYLILPKPAVIPHLPHHPYDPMNANAFLAHMAQLHYDMIQQTQRQESMYDETDPRESSINNSMSKSKSSRSFNKEKETSRRSEELTRLPMLPDSNGLLNFNPTIAEKYGDKAINSILDRIHGRINNEKKEYGYGDRTNHMIDRISDRADKDRTDYSFGFPGREIDSRENDSRHPENDINHPSNQNNNERDANGNYLSTNTTPAPNNSNRNDDHQGGY